MTFCVLLALKISGAVDMSWWLVFSPPLIILGIILFLSIFTGIFGEPITDSNLRRDG